MTKSELRKIYLEKRRSLSVEEVAERSRKIADRFFESFDLSKVKTLHCFIPIAKFNELDTSLIYKKIWTDFRAVKTLAPRINVETSEMESLIFGPETQLVENEWGIPEPLGGESIRCATFDVVLMPLLCFDKHGHRVGYGKGFYDKFLANCRPDCMKIGLSYFSPVKSIDDIGGHDVALDACVSPDNTYFFKE